MLRQATNLNVTVLRQGTEACHAPYGATRFPHGIPDIFNPPLAFPTLLIGNPWLSPCRVTRMKGTEEKDIGFPLTTGGNDRGGPAV